MPFQPARWCSVPAILKFGFRSVESSQGISSRVYVEEREISAASSLQPVGTQGRLLASTLINVELDASGAKSYSSPARAT